MITISLYGNNLSHCKRKPAIVIAPEGDVSQRNLVLSLICLPELLLAVSASHGVASPLIDPLKTINVAIRNLNTENKISQHLFVSSFSIIADLDFMSVHEIKPHMQ